MFITTLTCRLRKVTGLNQYSEETLGPPTTERCAPVRLRHNQEPFLGARGQHGVPRRRG
jgi:hypothetical protein